MGCDVDVVRIHRNIDDFLMNQIERDGIYIIRETSNRMAYAQQKFKEQLFKEK